MNLVEITIRIGDASFKVVAPEADVPEFVQALQEAWAAAAAATAAIAAAARRP